MSLYYRKEKYDTNNLMSNLIKNKTLNIISIFILKTFTRFISKFSDDNKVLIISRYSYSTATNNGVLLNKYLYNFIRIIAL